MMLTSSICPEKMFAELLIKLSDNKPVYTKTRNRENQVRIDGRRIMVSTIKSSPKFEEIPHEMIIKSFQALIDMGEVTQKFLTDELNIKRSAFIFASFTKLDYIRYNEDKNSLILDISKINH